MTTSTFPGAADNDANLIRVIATDINVPGVHNALVDAIEAIEGTLLSASSPATQYLRGDMTFATPSGGGGGGPLAVGAYAPGADTVLSTTGASFIDVDATHMAVTFTAPSSGNVLVRVTVPAGSSNATNNVYVDLRESTTDLGGTSRMFESPSGGVFFSQAFCFYLTGVSAGVHTYKLGFKSGGSGTACELYVGPSYGQAVFEVWGN